ncbi:hypothetical protein ALI22I_12655 [Saccharothrix sp. ALI-22-I]|uniref:hypothetical protein n=1 Tax=Saccharothrix sp. ALI-22-I TaxID=1933778 RepID=UPI00097C69A3|nr:hypothetical protein [Saccharothrix sp. ALI-22-I]ONI90176.1 hypothetical protein ALI22I_12655 [Saccharothrix sp. ALI-22-I]
MYRVVPDAETFEQVAALPVEALHHYAEVLAVLELQPWSGRPQHESNPGAAVRYWNFGPDGAGQAVYLILEEQREVHLLLVQWLA